MSSALIASHVEFPPKGLMTFSASPSRWLRRNSRWALELQQFQFDVHYRKGKLNVVADALSRHPLGVCQQAVEAEPDCKWVANMRARIAEEPAKFPDYVEENRQLYRNLGYRADGEDFIPWKLCVPSGQRKRVLQVLLARYVSGRRPSGGASNSEASLEGRLVPSPIEVERVEHQVPSLAMEPVAADEWIVEDEEMVNEETADEERVEHQVPLPAMELVATDEWLSEDEEMADGRRVEHPVPSPAMKDVVADEWSVEDEEPADGQPVDHPVRPPVRKTLAADGELMEDADRQRLPSDVPIFSARAPTARVDRPDSPPASENSGEAEPAAEGTIRQQGVGGGPLQYIPPDQYPVQARCKWPNTPKKSRHKASHKRRVRDTSPKVTTQSVSAARVVVHEEDRSVTELMPPEDGLLRAGSNMPTQITHAERVGGDVVSPTESELLRDMEKMLDGWEPDLDEVFGEVVDPEATLLPLIPATGGFSRVARSSPNPLSGCYGRRWSGVRDRIAARASA
ncbi:hypothetical protein ACLKA6_016904 [Drosophila palustris]